MVGEGGRTLINTTNQGGWSINLILISCYGLRDPSRLPDFSPYPLALPIIITTLLYLTSQPISLPWLCLDVESRQEDHHSQLTNYSSFWTPRGISAYLTCIAKGVELIEVEVTYC